MVRHTASRKESSVADNKVYKLVEIVGTSEKGFAEAVRAGVERAAKSLRNLDWFEVTELRGRVTKNKVSQFQVKLKVGFRLEGD
jgi:dodecin